MFRYYLLGNYAVALSGLYSRLCHAFLIIVDFYVRFFCMVIIHCSKSLHLFKSENVKYNFL